MRAALLLLALALGLTAQTARAQTAGDTAPPAQADGVTVSPAGCDFEVIFPSQPYSSRRCPDGAAGQCYDLTRYTMVYEMTTTVDVRFSCNPLMPGQYEQYNEQVTRMALNGMAARNGVQESRTNFSQENDIRRTTLTGSGTSGRQNKVYIAQLWLSPRSILTMEAELIGPEHGQADDVFGEILKSVALKGANAAAKAAPADPAATPPPAPAPAPVSP